MFSVTPSSINLTLSWSRWRVGSNQSNWFRRDGGRFWRSRQYSFVLWLATFTRRRCWFCSGSWITRLPFLFLHPLVTSYIHLMTFRFARRSSGDGGGVLTRRCSSGYGCGLSTGILFVFKNCFNMRFMFFIFLLCTFPLANCTPRERKIS